MDKGSLNVSLLPKNGSYQLNRLKTNTNKSMTFKSQNEPHKKDIFTQYPVRLFAFTNEVGAAVAPVTGPVGELLSYIPTLSYIFLVTRDRYKKGLNGNSEKPSTQKALEELSFQTLASVILPTASVKTAQAITNKILDKESVQPYKNKVKGWINKNQRLKNIINKFADKPHNTQKGALTKFALGFQRTLDYITVAPLFFKQPHNKSGLRNIGLALVGLTTLGCVIKPIDHFVEKVIIDKAVKPMLGIKEDSKKS